MTATDDFAEQAIGKQRETEAAQERAALKDKAILDAHVAGYGFATRDLEVAVVNLRAFSRGMVAAECLPTYIAQAREALDRVEASLK